MIEVNLIPDVKLELLKARRQQRLVISGSILVAIVSVGVVVLLSIYAFGVQTVADTFADNGIKDNSKKLAAVEDLSQTLTLQAQLNKLSEIQSNQHMTSRLFDVLTATIPKGVNEVNMTRLNFDSENNTIEIEAEAANGYEAMEVFKKTLAQTKLQYRMDGEVADPINIASDISEGERNYGENSKGEQILRFTLSFTYPDELFDATITDTKVVGPNEQRATDSTRGVPNDLFSSDGDDK